MVDSTTLSGQDNLQLPGYEASDGPPHHNGSMV